MTVPIHPNPSRDPNPIRHPNPSRDPNPSRRANVDRDPSHYANVDRDPSHRAMLRCYASVDRDPSHHVLWHATAGHHSSHRAICRGVRRLDSRPQTQAIEGPIGAIVSSSL
jgi:hypothetical protein